MSINCPKCKTSTKPFNFETDLIFDRCESCKGMWMDKGELARISFSEHDFPETVQFEQAYETKFECPKCTHDLYQVGYGGTKHRVEVCRSCEGLWLDSSELKAVQKILREHRIEMKKKDKNL